MQQVLHCIFHCNPYALQHTWRSWLQNRWRKRGLAVTPTKFGIAFTKLTYNQGGALVHVYTDGTVCCISTCIQMSCLAAVLVRWHVHSLLLCADMFTAVVLLCE
jgi:hypothetical protein